MDKVAAIDELAKSLPEFTPEDYGTNEDGSPLFHLVMGDLYRFYFEVAGNEEVERRYWAVVEQLAVHGDDGVENAVGVSLIEHFSSDPSSQARFRNARRFQGPATREMGAGLGL